MFLCMTNNQKASYVAAEKLPNPDLPHHPPMATLLLASAALDAVNNKRQDTEGFW